MARHVQRAESRLTPSADHPQHRTIFDHGIASPTNRRYYSGLDGDDLAKGLRVDSIDLHIIEALQANARTSNADLARELDMAPSAVLERIRKLEQKGVLTGYEARIAPREVGLSLTAFVFVRAEERPVIGKTGVELARIPEVQEVHHVAGEDCYLVKVRVRDTEDLSRVLQHDISGIKTVKGTRTTIVLSTVKETARLSLAEFSKGLGEVTE